jgi:FkbM family methyltransferase
MAVLVRVASAMRRGPLAPLYPVARDLVLAVLRAKAGVESGIAGGIRVPLTWLPIGVQSKLKHAFAPVARLDYGPHRILLHVDSADALYRTAACRKEPETVRWIEDHVQAGDVLYDVGANVGAYSLIAAKRGGGQVRVFAFEPSFATYDELCRNVVLNGCEATITPLLMCVTEAPGLVTFGHSSLEPGSALHVTAEAAGVVPQSAVYRQAIPGFSIDALVTQFCCPIPNHIKIDVDGTELSVLKGAHQTLDASELRTIQVEVSPQEPSALDVRTLLESKGFRLASQTSRGGGTRWSNYLFVRP